MKINQLMQHWEKEHSGEISNTKYEVQFSVEDAARLEALVEMFPKHGRENIIRDLMATALAELTNAFPYKQGTKIVAQDEEGDPMYEDIGPTPKFLNLTRKHLSEMKSRVEH